ncbi:MAG: EndoU domain-containing protein [Solobacterium sp.]|nr:EndoU domain-containing protein [Solobacterium sp.]
MKKRSFLLYILIGIWLGFTLYQTAFRRPAEPSFQPVPVQPDTPAAAEEVLYTDADIRALEHTELFYDSTIVHIFYGEINQKGNGNGYHYDRVADTPGKIVEGTRSEEDRYGVYTAMVEVDGVPKTGNKGYSSFFPDDMSPQEVIDAVNQAYENMEKLSGDLYAGICDAGFEIDIVTGDDGRIVTAYPVKEE